MTESYSFNLQEVTERLLHQKLQIINSVICNRRMDNYFINQLNDLSRKTGISVLGLQIYAYMYCHSDEVTDTARLVSLLRINLSTLDSEIQKLYDFGALYRIDDRYELQPDFLKYLAEEMNERAKNKKEVATETELYKILNDLIKKTKGDPISNPSAEDMINIVMPFMDYVYDNQDFQFCKRLLELRKTITDDKDFSALLIITNQFIQKGLSPLSTTFAGMEGLIKKGYVSVIIEKSGDEHIKKYLIGVDVCKKLFYGHPEMLNYSNLLGQCDLIKSDSIEKKPLFFEESDKKTLKMVEDACQPDKYAEITDRLKERHLPPQLTILLHGAPGTGKTEFVRQLARRTGKDIFIADVSKLNMSYIGESEKSYKELFRNFKYFAALSQNAPILLFNEADGILSKRLENQRNSCDKLDNTIQSILLQEIETFEGIFIATTNLAGNLDSAFDRRFLFKCQMHKPSVSTREKIVSAMLPELSDSEIQTIASFDFSGGNLQNIATKINLQFAIYGQMPSFEEIEEMCEQECLESGKPQQRNRIKGFMNY